MKQSARDSNVIEFNKRPAWRRPLILLPWAVAATIALAAVINHSSSFLVSGKPFRRSRYHPSCCVKRREERSQ